LQPGQNLRVSPLVYGLPTHFLVSSSLPHDSTRKLASVARAAARACRALAPPMCTCIRSHIFCFLGGVAALPVTSTEEFSICQCHILSCQCHILSIHSIQKGKVICTIVNKAKGDLRTN
jgi:hypothetical protein